MGPVSVLLPPHLVVDEPFLFQLDELLFDWKEARKGLLHVHGIERTSAGVVVLMAPAPPIGFRDAAKAARQADLDERIAWGATRVVDACRAVSTLRGPHRSLTPETVAFDVEGHVVVLPPITRHMGLRLQMGAGKIRGNVRFLSPEGVMGGPSDARSDVFQLAQLLRCLLGAQPAFARETEIETIQAIVSREPPRRLRDENIHVPTALDDAIHAALSHDPAARPSSPSELATMLLPFVDETRASASAIPSRALQGRSADGNVETPLAALFEGPIWKPCRKRWEELTPTNEPAVRDCSECNQSVQRAQTTLDLVMIGGGCAFWDPKQD
jgi:serine/threonine protein kinase